MLKYVSIYVEETKEKKKRKERTKLTLNKKKKKRTWTMNIYSERRNEIGGFNINNY